jgi:hypothetical protein
MRCACPHSLLLFTRPEAEAQKGPVTASLSRTTRSEQQTAETILSAPAPPTHPVLGPASQDHITQEPHGHADHTSASDTTPMARGPQHRFQPCLGRILFFFFFLIEKKSCSCSGTWLVPSGIPLAHPYPLTNLQADTPSGKLWY